MKQREIHLLVSNWEQTVAKQVHDASRRVMKNGFFDIQEFGTMPSQSMENKGTLVARANDQKFAISHWLASRENLDTCMLFVH
jgi:hypothetical protein